MEKKKGGENYSREKFLFCIVTHIIVTPSSPRATLGQSYSERSP